MYVRSGLSLSLCLLRHSLNASALFCSRAPRAFFSSTSRRGAPPGRPGRRVTPASGGPLAAVTPPYATSRGGYGGTGGRGGRGGRDIHA